MRKGCCRMAAAFSLRKEYQMTGKNEKKAEKMGRTFSCSSDVTDGLRQHRINGKQHIVRVGHFGSF